MAFRSELAEARQQQQRRYESDLSHYKAKERQREQERRERWLARHRVVGSPGLGSGSRLGYRLAGQPGQPGQHRGGPSTPRGPGRGPGFAPSRGPSLSASYTSSAFSTSSRASGSRSSRRSVPQALVPWGHFAGPPGPPPAAASTGSCRESAGAGRNKHDDATGSQSRPPEPPPRPRPVVPDVGAIRLAFKMKQENLEYERRQRQRQNRGKEMAATARRRIPKNDPGHRLGRTLGPAMGPSAEQGFGRPWAARPMPSRTAPRTTARPTTLAANPEPTITFPADDADGRAGRGSPYVLSATSRDSSYTAPCYPPMQALPRAARSPTVARNTPAASTTSTPKVLGSPKPAPAAPLRRPYPTYRAFAVPRTVTPSHNCGMDHPHPHRQAPGAHSRASRMTYVSCGPGDGGSGSARPGAQCGPAGRPRAQRVTPASAAIKIGTGVILPQVKLATIVVVPKAAPQLAAESVPPKQRPSPAPPSTSSPSAPAQAPCAQPQSVRTAAPPGRGRPGAAGVHTAKGPGTVSTSRTPRPKVLATLARAAAANPSSGSSPNKRRTAPPAPPVRQAKVQKTMGRPWR